MQRGNKREYNREQTIGRNNVMLLFIARVRRRKIET